MDFKKSFTVDEIKTEKVEKKESETLTKKLTLEGEGVRMTIKAVPELLPQVTPGDEVEIIVKPTPQTKLLSVEEVEEIEKEKELEEEE